MWASRTPPHAHVHPVDHLLLEPLPLHLQRVAAAAAWRFLGAALLVYAPAAAATQLLPAGLLPLRLRLHDTRVELPLLVRAGKPTMGVSRAYSDGTVANRNYVWEFGGGR